MLQVHHQVNINFTNNVYLRFYVDGITLSIHMHTLIDLLGEIAPSGFRVVQTRARGKLLFCARQVDAPRARHQKP